MSKMVIEDGKFVELTYKVIDKKTKEVLSEVEFPLGYIQATPYQGYFFTLKI
jgi:FKBP-type peptidyl-prolyl cis-trans isomerase SlyD